MAPLERCPELISLDPKTLDDVFGDTARVGRALGRDSEAAALVAALRTRLERMRQRVAGRRRTRVAALEWLEPPFTAGHWVLEMIAWAVGEDLFARPGEVSTRRSWAELASADPDWIVAMPCGFDAAGARRQLDRLAAREEWRRLRAVGAGRVAAVDANGLFSRPGPRLVDGVEKLERIFGGTGDGSGPSAG